MWFLVAWAVMMIIDPRLCSLVGVTHVRVYSAVETRAGYSGLASSCSLNAPTRTARWLLIANIVTHRALLCSSLQIGLRMPASSITTAASALPTV